MRIARNASVARFAVRALMTAAAASVSAVGAAQESHTPGLTIAIIDLAEAPGLMPASPAEIRRPSWRTSFGSERQTEVKSKASTAGPLAALADADAVLIQGVRAAAPLRRLFPPRAWRLVVSRRIIAPPTDGTGADAGASRSLPAATAIAVRARSDIRVTAREPGLRLTAPGADPAAGPPIAATAVRVAAHGRVVWLASVVLPPACAERKACPAEAGLDAWRTSKRGYGETTLVGGRLTAMASPGASSSAGPPTPCAAHRIESDLVSEPLRPAGGPALREGSGCISIVRLEGAPPQPPAPSVAAEADAVAKSPTTP